MKLNGKKERTFFLPFVTQCLITTIIIAWHFQAPDYSFYVILVKIPLIIQKHWRVFLLLFFFHFQFSMSRSNITSHVILMYSMHNWDEKRKCWGRKEMFILNTQQKKKRRNIYIQYLNFKYLMLFLPSTKLHFISCREFQ